MVRLFSELDVVEAESSLEELLLLPVTLLRLPFLEMPLSLVTADNVDNLEEILDSPTLAEDIACGLVLTVETLLVDVELVLLVAAVVLVVELTEEVVDEAVVIDADDNDDENEFDDERLREGLFNVKDEDEVDDEDEWPDVDFSKDLELEDDPPLLEMEGRLELLLEVVTVEEEEVVDVDTEEEGVVEEVEEDKDVEVLIVVWVVTTVDELLGRLTLDDNTTLDCFILSKAAEDELDALLLDETFPPLPTLSLELLEEEVEELPPPPEDGEELLMAEIRAEAWRIGLGPPLLLFESLLLEDEELLSLLLPPSLLEEEPLSLEELEEEDLWLLLVTEELLWPK